MKLLNPPRYRIIAQQIEDRIVSGRYPPGSALPPEPALEREFGVSRITVRQALDVLKRRGLLYSRSGVGTLVRTDGLQATSVKMTGSLTDLINYGAETSYIPLDRRLVVPPTAVAEALGLRGKRVPVLSFRGIRTRRRGAPFGFEEVYIPESLGVSLDNRRPGWQTLFSLLEEAHGFEIVEASQVITAVAAPVIVTRHLALRPRAPVLRVTRTYKTAAGRNVEVAVSHYDPSKFQYLMTLYRD